MFSNFSFLVNFFLKRFIHSHEFFFYGTQKVYILKNVGNQTVPIDFHYICCPHNESQ